MALPATGVAAAATQAKSAVATADLTVGVSSGDPSVFAALTVGNSKGWFAKQHINVNVALVGTLAAQNFISGQVPLQIGSVFTPSTLASQGVPVKEIYGTASGIVSAYVGAKPGITSIDQCKTLATFLPGTPTYGYALIYKNLFHLNSNIVTESSQTGAGTAVATGAVDCGIGTFGAFAPYVATNTVHVIINPQTGHGLPKGFLSTTGAVMFGAPAYLKAHRAAIVGFLKGFHQAMVFVKVSSNAPAVAQIMSQQAIEAGKLAASLQSTVSQEQWSLEPCLGYISKASWVGQLAFLTQAGTSVVGQKYSYSNLVDMSYYNAAFKANSATLSCTG